MDLTSILIGLFVGIFSGWLIARAREKDFARNTLKQHCFCAEQIIAAVNRDEVEKARQEVTFVENYTNEFENDRYKITELEDKGEESMIGIYVKEEDIWLAIGTYLYDNGERLKTMTFYYCCKPDFKSPLPLV